ncbi:NACHT domain-containing protein [Archangium sp.]|uniref:NACHT domain-containing protein n=1 Tax=Archangium sp. TaxID=1872627 RepID=UPI002D6D6279|nr:NACHT domain-containing protein [Archangium sp.]HYO52483.1 NACHT domain-containing protein [Archangium sp.]
MAGKVEEKLQEQTAATAFQLVWGSIKGLGNLVVDENAVQRGMKEYARKFLERYGNIKVLNMDQPVPLSEIYVAAQVLSPRSVRSFSSVDELHEVFLQRGQRRLSAGAREERRDCLELANEEQLLNVLGAPGAGKSTFLRRLGLEALRPRRAWNDSLLTSLGLRAGLEDSERSRYAHDCLPVLIELRRFRTDEIDLVQLIQNELTTCGLPESDKLVKALLDGGRLLLLLDGIDEVPGDRLDKAITHMRDFVDRYSSNRFVVSCRTAFYRDYFSRFRDVLLADFDDAQIANFVRNWFRSDQDRQRGTAAEFLKTLGEPAHASAKELASTPLLLTFLCLTYDDRQRLPPNRSELYRQALEILMERWAASKRVHNEPIYRELHARLEVQMLAEIAAPAFRDNRYFFTRRELIDHITGFLHGELNAPKHLDGSQVLNAIEIQHRALSSREPRMRGRSRTSRSKSTSRQCGMQATRSSTISSANTCTIYAGERSSSSWRESSIKRMTC